MTAIYTPTEIIYTPTEIIEIYNQILSIHNKLARCVYLKGIYLKGNNSNYSNYYYDYIKDETTDQQIKIVISNNDRHKLTNNNLVEVYGVIDRKISPFKNLSSIEIQFNVTRVIDIVQEIKYTENEKKLNDLFIKKNGKGFTNVDVLIEKKIYASEKPKIIVLFPQNNVTEKEFHTALGSTIDSIELREERLVFSKSPELFNKLEDIDNQHFDAIAFVRGGGAMNAGGIFDDPEVIEKIISLKTPIISAVGHEQESYFIKRIADKTLNTPTALGTYFKDIVENTSKAKNESLDAMRRQVDNEYKKLMIEKDNNVKIINEKFENKNKELVSFKELFQKQSSEKDKQIEEKNSEKDSINKIYIELKQQLEKQITDKDNLINDLNSRFDENRKTLQVTIDKLTTDLSRVTKFNKVILIFAIVISIILLFCIL
jgi:hypothetical protein